MARFKPAKGQKKKSASSARGAIPCLLVLLGAMLLMYLLFVSVLSPR
ncbi:MAG: hypothetical protein KJZ78_26925 [Bryobacteraceae bacterium]|nr:hypothetical protein [Bryobacteraceae bacterium]HEU0139142.1 hypothetical protein [Bryobacteraceae bacterium]